MQFHNHPGEPFSHALEPVFRKVVHNIFQGRLGLHDTAVNSYVTHLLCEFSDAEKLYRVRDIAGRSVDKLFDMRLAADPITGTAASFDAERAVRKHMGDYALFIAGMYPEATSHRHQSDRDEVIRIGKESYRIVSTFDLEEYAEEAPLFKRLSGDFERYVFGLTVVREDLTKPTGTAPSSLIS